MIIFLYGSDRYRLKENIDTIVEAYRKKHKNGISYYRFNFNENDAFDAALASRGGASDLFSAIQSVSFFDETKLVVVKNLFSAGADFSDKLFALITNLGLTADKKTVVVFVENRKKIELQKADKNLFTILNTKPNLVKEIDYLEGSRLSNWTRIKFKDNGHNVSPAVADLLVDMVGNESWALANEISKISNYLTGKVCQARPVRPCLLMKEDVGMLVSQKENISVFELVDAVGSQNKSKAFEIMYRLVNSGHDGYYLLNMLSYHFENLLSVCDLMEKDKSLSSLLIANKCGLHPFVAKKAASQARKFNKEDLLARFNCLADLDINSKRGSANLEDSLYNFVIS